MKFHFVPFRAEKTPQSWTNAEAISQHQHAAREYHRRKRLHNSVTFSKASRTRKKGKELDSEQAESQAEMAAFSHNVPVGSPQSAALGAGRVDPFNAYCQQDVPLYVHEMLDHALSYQWSKFRFSDGEAGLNTIKAEIMECIITNPAAWYAFIFGGATHNAFQYGGRELPKFNEQLRLIYKSKAIRRILADIEQDGENLSDGTLMSIVTLAAHGSGESLKGQDFVKIKSQPSLLTAHDVNFYMSMDTGWEHLNILCSILEKRGGLQTVKIKSVAISMQLYDILSSWSCLQAPKLALMAPTSYYISLRTHSPDEDATFLAKRLVSGIVSMPNDAGELDSLLEIAKHASIVSMDLDQYQRSRKAPQDRQTNLPDICHVNFTRWCVLHDSLTLPVRAIRDSHRLADLIYELLRLTILAYCAIVLVPMPPSRPLPGMIAAKLEDVLDACVNSKVSDSPHVQQPSLFLSSVILGGICAVQAPEADVRKRLANRFVDFVEYVSVKPDPHAWPIVTNILSDFLWLGSECDEPGKEFWTLACEALATES